MCCDALVPSELRKSVADTAFEEEALFKVVFLLCSKDITRKHMTSKVEIIPSNHLRHHQG